MKDEAKPSRASVLQAVIDEILARKDGQIPTDIDGIHTFFHGTEDLISALLLRWHTRLVSSLERALADDPEDRSEAVIEGWCHANMVYRDVRAILDELAENPPTDEIAHAVRITARNDRAKMAIAAGLASGFDEPAVRVGHRLELEARRRSLELDTSPGEPKPQTFLKRVRAMLIG